MKKNSFFLTNLSIISNSLRLKNIPTNTNNSLTHWRIAYTLSIFSHLEFFTFSFYHDMGSEIFFCHADILSFFILFILS